MLKRRLFDAGVHYIVLYSGSNAVGFFRKVGFTDSSRIDLGEDLISPRVEVFQRATQLGCDMTEEFLRPEAQSLSESLRIGDIVSVRYGYRKVQWRQAYIIEKKGLKICLQFVQRSGLAGGKLEWVPVASRRLLVESNSLAGWTQEPSPTRSCPTPQSSQSTDGSERRGKKRGSVSAKPKKKTSDKRRLTI
jgi:hypothetical protein